MKSKNVTAEAVAPKTRFNGVTHQWIIDGVNEIAKKEARSFSSTAGGLLAEALWYRNRSRPHSLGICYYDGNACHKAVEISDHEADAMRDVNINVIAYHNVVVNKSYKYYTLDKTGKILLLIPTAVVKSRQFESILEKFSK
jgi:hypothetical protein